MTINKRFEYPDDKKITTQKADSIDNFLWVAFSINSDGNCIIEKEAKFQPTQTYYSLTRDVDEVNAMDLDSTNLYVSYIDDTLLGEIISKTTPLSINTEISRDSIVESPVDVLVNGSDLWYLLPGNASGTNTQLLRYDLSGVLQQIVDLNKSGEVVINASSMTIDDSGDFWIVTYTNPATVVRVFEISGGLYDFSVTDII